MRRTGPVRAAQPGDVRLMLVGDSITQGSTGDYTWRYFLDRHLRRAGQRFDLVGHTDDLYDPGTDAPGSHDYADPEFDQDHASRWGNSLAWPRVPIAGLAAELKPDVVVLALGTNDLSFLGQTPRQTWDRTAQTVADLREVDPDVAVVLVEVPGPGVPGAPALNQMLRSGAPHLSTAASPVVVARASEGFVPSGPEREGDTWDTLHPDTSGQVRIAAAVADALAELRIGAAYRRPLEFPPDGLRHPPRLSALPGHEEVVLTWEGPPGATGHDIWLREDGAPWRLRHSDVPGSACTLAPLRPGGRYQVKVRARKGFTPAAPDMDSPVVAVLVPGGVGTPLSTIPAVVGEVVAQGRRNRLLVTWQSSRGAEEYLVLVRSRDSGQGWTHHRVRGSRVVVRGLAAGARLDVRVHGVNAAGVGPGSVVRSVRAGGARPPRARRPEVRATRRGAVVVDWPPVRSASGYQVQVRRRGVGRWRDLGDERVVGTRVRVPLSPRGQSVRVRAWNDEIRGRWSPARGIRPRS